MTDKRRKMQGQYAGAKARLDQADEDVRRTSGRRLTELMDVPERQRLAHLGDPTLTPEDRASLLRSVAAKLPPPRARLFGRIIPAIQPSFRLRRRLIALIMAIVPIAPGLIWTAMSWKNTATMYMFQRPIRVEWHEPSGEPHPVIVAAGREVALIDHLSGRSHLRYWIAGQGYATAEFNPAWSGQ
ncbi:hypothetical protein [Bradyrhizobium cenepequi]